MVHRELRYHPLLGTQRSPSLPKYRPLLLTFDDGLASVIDYAVPILRQKRISALMFLTTGWTDAKQTPFIFQLEKLIYEKAPLTLELLINQEPLKLDIRDRGDVDPSFKKLWNFLFQLKSPPLALTADQIRINGQPISEEGSAPQRDFWLPASWMELKSAVREGVLEIGSHMQSHLPLSWLNFEQLHEQMGGSRKRLEEEFGTAVEACSYPHGLYNDLTAKIASQHYRWAFSIQPGLLRAKTPRTCVPRIHVPGECWSRIQRSIRFARWDKYNFRAFIKNKIA